MVNNWFAWRSDLKEDWLTSASAIVVFLDASTWGQLFSFPVIFSFSWSLHFVRFGFDCWASDQRWISIMMTSGLSPLSRRIPPDP